MRKNTMSDIWKRVDRNGPIPACCPELGPCWVWTGTAHRRSGYGVITIGGRQYRAHRIAWQLTHGPIPGGLLVCHECDNPPCCNPTHLRADDHNGNVRDKVKRNRQAQGQSHSALLREVARRGTANHKSKLTDDQVRSIRSQCSKGKSQRSIARDFGVGKNAIYRIVHRRTWAHVT